MREATQTTTPDTVLAQLRALGVDVQTYTRTYTRPGAFDPCLWRDHDDDVDAVCGIYSRDESSREVCLGCVVSAADSAVEDSHGRPDLVTIEVLSGGA